MKKLFLIFFLLSNLFLAQNYFFNNHKVVKSITNIESKEYYDAAQLQFDVFDSKGNKLYSIKKNVEYDIPHPGVAVFENGTAVLINSFDASLEYYNIVGQKIKTINLFSDREVTYERSIYFDAVGDMIVVLVSQPEYEKSEVIVLDNNGEKLSNWHFEAKNASGIKISEDLSTIAVSGFNWFHNLVEVTNFYSANGNLKFSLPFKFNKAKFYKEGFAGITNKSICFVDLKMGKLIWKKEAAENKLFGGVSINENSIHLVETDKPVLDSGKWIYSRLILQAFDKTGNKMDEALIYNTPFENINITGKNNSIKIFADNIVVYSK